MRNTFFKILVALLFCAAAWGQGLSTINGSVADPSGAVIPGANIMVKEVDTGLSRTTVSNADGLYVLSSLRPTGYALTVGAPGFRTTTQTGITLQANDVVTINLKLEMGAVFHPVPTPSRVDTAR